MTPNTKSPSTHQSPRENIESAFLNVAKSVAGAALVRVHVDVLPIATAAITHSILHDKKLADMPICNIHSVKLVQSTPPRIADPLGAYAAADLKQEKLLILPIDMDKHRNHDIPYELIVAKELIKPGECVIIQIDCFQLSYDDAIAKLSRLDTAAREMGVLVVVLMPGRKMVDMSYLNDHCALYIDIEACDPEPDAQIALAVTNVTLAGWHIQGIGRVQVDGLLMDDGTWKYRTEPLIAKRATTRLAWYLAHAGFTPAATAKIIGPTKPSVLADLAALTIPPSNSVGLKPPAAWLDRWKLRYDSLAAQVEATAKTSQSAGNSAHVELRQHQ